MFIHFSFAKERRELDRFRNIEEKLSLVDKFIMLINHSKWLLDIQK